MSHPSWAMISLTYPTWAEVTDAFPTYAAMGSIESYKHMGWTITIRHLGS